MPKRTRSAEAKARRNQRRRERRDSTMDNRDRAEAFLFDVGDKVGEQQAHLQFYNTTAYNSKGNWKDEVLERLTDGSSRPEYCTWFKNRSSDTPGVLQQLQAALEDAVTRALTPPVSEQLSAWSELPRSSQGENCPFKKPTLSADLDKSAEGLAVSFASVLGSSTAKSPQCNIRARLTRDLLLAISQPGVPEDLDICNEVQRGCHVGYGRPVRATGLWPKDRGPKHSGFGLSYEDGQVWKNYRSADDVADLVQATLDDEVAKGHMAKLPAAPEGAVITKLACVPKPNGKVRLIDDLRRSGVNEKIHCEETICLPGLASAAFLVQQQKKRSPEEELVWIEADIASAFRHIPVHVDDQKLLLNHVGQWYFRHLRLPFGLRSSPLLWCRYFACVHRILKKLVPSDTDIGSGMIYVDDLGWITTRRESLRMLLRILLVYKALGLDVAYDKLRITSSPHSLGFEWDLASQTVRVPEPKRLSLVEETQLVVDSFKFCSVPISLIERVTGRLSWLCQVTPRLRHLLQPWYALKKAANSRHLRVVRVGEKLVDSARSFLEVLRSPSLTHTTASQVLGWEDSGGIPETVVVADSSLSAMGGVLFQMGENPMRTEWFHWSFSDELARLPLVNSSVVTSSDICPLELIAVGVGISRAFARGSRVVHVLTDNKATMSAINKNYSSSPRMSQVLYALRELWPKVGYMVTAHHLSGPSNVLADFLSRSELDVIRKSMVDVAEEGDISGILDGLLKSVSAYSRA